MLFRSDRGYWEQWFPADLVLEMREQIRLWFYSMLFMSTALTNRAPYKRVLVYEKVYDEKGEPMHKSAGNAIWFDDAAEKMGVDVMRWIYCAQNPNSNLNFGYGLADDTRRKLLTLWNVYSFWVTYADIDGFDPTKHQMPVSERSDLDRWILARLHSLIGTARRSIEALDTPTVVRAVDAFVDDLSNWYVRRSRRRFWKSGEDADKVAAHLTLYECLVTLAKVVAPMLPFLAEVMYQNLVRSVDQAAPVSVHLHPYPEVEESLVDRRLLSDVELVQRIVNLGRAARNKAAIKVRQPVGELLVAVPSSDAASVLQRLAPQIIDELNVKRLEVVGDLGELVTHTVRPRTPILGPKYGRELPKIAAALRERPAAEVAARVARGEPVELAGHEILPEELEVMTSDREGYASAVEGDLAVAVSTALTPELVDEGIARELVHRIQGMRKSAGFRIEDYIATTYEGDPELTRVLARFAAYVRQETLSRELAEGSVGTAEYSESLKLDGRVVSIGVTRVN